MNASLRSRTGPVLVVTRRDLEERQAKTLCLLLLWERVSAMRLAEKGC